MNNRENQKEENVGYKNKDDYACQFCTLASAVTILLNKSMACRSQS